MVCISTHIIVFPTIGGYGKFQKLTLSKQPPPRISVTKLRIAISSKTLLN